MRCSIDCFVAKGFTSEVSDHSTQAIHAWHVAKTRFVTSLSTKEIRPGTSDVSLCEKVGSGDETTCVRSDIFGSNLGAPIRW